MDEYQDLFKPIPHADLLPTDILARIPLKDKYKPLRTCKYSVPQAIRPKFKELIDLCLSQGFIQPTFHITFLCRTQDRSDRPTALGMRLPPTKCEHNSWQIPNADCRWHPRGLWQRKDLVHHRLWMVRNAPGIPKLPRNSPMSHNKCTMWIYWKNMPYLSRWLLPMGFWRCRCCY